MFSKCKKQNEKENDVESSEKQKLKLFDTNDQSYFQMIQIIGSSGRYQTLCLILWCLVWFVAGELLLGTPFLLYSPPYSNCPQEIQQNCSEYVCKLPFAERSKYLFPQFESLAMQFGDYHCQNQYKLQLTQALVYFGSFTGYLVVSWLNDNLGRKKSIMIGLVSALLGILLISSSKNLLMAQIGLFIAGFGIDPSINTVFYFITQTVGNRYRQKQSTLIQFFFSLAGFVNVLNYLIFNNWRVIWWIFFFVPLLISTLLIYIFIHQTPQFMIMLYQPEQTLKSLKQMAIINGSQFFQSEQNSKIILAHIQKLHLDYMQKKQNHKKHLNFIDMFKYPSIRYISIYVCIITFNVYLMYYGPLMLLEQYHFNIYISAIVITGSQLIVYPLAYFYIGTIKRKFIGKLLFFIAILCSIALFCIPESKDKFWQTLKLILIFVFRFVISFYFAIFCIYSTELFPAQIKGIAVGFASALGTVASASSPIVFGELQKISFPVMIIFIGLGSISFLCTFCLPQTLNVKLQQELEEFHQDMQEKRRTNCENNKQIELVQQIGQNQMISKKEQK